MNKTSHRFAPPTAPFPRMGPAPPAPDTAPTAADSRSDPGRGVHIHVRTRLLQVGPTSTTRHRTATRDRRHRTPQCPVLQAGHLFAEFAPPL